MYNSMHLLMVLLPLHRSTPTIYIHIVTTLLTIRRNHDDNTKGIANNDKPNKWHNPQLFYPIKKKFDGCGAFWWHARSSHGRQTSNVKSPTLPVTIAELIKRSYTEKNRLRYHQGVLPKQTFLKYPPFAPFFGSFLLPPLPHAAAATSRYILIW